jgi:hypothetical protein
MTVVWEVYPSNGLNTIFRIGRYAMASNPWTLTLIGGEELCPAKRIHFPLSNVS